MVEAGVDGVLLGGGMGEAPVAEGHQAALDTHLDLSIDFVLGDRASTATASPASATESPLRPARPLSLREWCRRAAG
jgi:hypothetical protein